MSVHLLLLDITMVVTVILKIPLFMIFVYHVIIFVRHAQVLYKQIALPALKLVPYSDNY